MMLIACALGAPDVSLHDSDEARIRKTVMGLEEAWNAHDMKAFACQFAEDADFVNAAGAWWKGRAEIEQKHSAVHETIFRESRLTINSTDIRHLSRDIAIAHAATSVTGQRTPDGAAVPERKSRLFLVLRRRERAWVIAAAQNTEMRAPATAVQLPK